MNIQLFKQYIEEYKRKFESVNEQEIYKWEAIKCFQDNWDIDAEDFRGMITKSLDKTVNLLKSGSYYPLRMIEQYAELKPKELRELFVNLYNEDCDIYTRINNFWSGSKDINNDLFPGDNTYQDHRAIMVYLTLRYPEQYFFYKFTMFKKFAAKLEIEYKPKKGRIENVGQYNALCESIRFQLAKDQELIRLHKSRINSNCYDDINLNILAQDFIYAVTVHLELEHKPNMKLIVPELTNIISTVNIKTKGQDINFEGRVVNHKRLNAENKRIGDLGEQLVLKYEKNKLKELGLNKKAEQVKHTAIDEGDGTGYDIKSFDENGKSIYIEVKTTKGSKDSAFYITRTELARSIKEQEQYYLYRLYDYDEESDTAKFFIAKGELTNLCKLPETYKVRID
ncbi:MAG: DUF3883 domain-containing protein [Mangrovibacterium sp.]